MPKIALIDGPADSAAKSLDVTWEQWSKALHDVKRTDCSPCRGHDCEAKKGRAWIPAHFTAPERVDANVAAITFAVFDLDGPTEAQMQAMAGCLQGTSYLAHETHAPNSYRLILPLSEEIPASEWPATWAAIIRRFNIPADPTCRNLSHLYFTPSKVIGADFKIAVGEGPFLNWKELPPEVPDFKASALAAVKTMITPGPDTLREGPIDLEDMRRTVGAMRRPESRAMLDTILSGRRLTESFPRDVGFRDAAILQACGILATAPQGKPYATESVIALLLGSIRAMDTSPEGLDSWLNVAREKYTRKVAERLERDTRADADRNAILNVLGAGSSATEDWRKELIWGPKDKEGNPTGLRQTGSNAAVVFQHAPEFKGAIKFNALTRDIEVHRGPLKGLPAACLDVEAKNWLAHSEFKLFLSTFEIREQILSVARRQEYDPLRDWLEQLPAWDGLDRVTEFFAHYFDAEGPSEYLGPISRCFLISCIARAMSPGCKVDTAPIMVGGQGAGKSRGSRALGQPFFTDQKIVMGDKDSQLLIAGHWIVELAELSGWKAVDTETIKNFMSRAEDKFRPPYGHAPETFPRRCVFIGTTNEEEMLTDKENRRWWPMRVGKVKVDKLAEHRNQIFAQALALYRAGQQWHLTDEEALIAKAQAEQFTAPSGARAEQIIAWYVAKPQSERPAEISMIDMVTQVFAIPSAQVGRVVQLEAAKAMRDVGFVKIRKRFAGQLRYMYVAPQALLSAPLNAKPSTLELVGT